MEPGKLRHRLIVKIWLDASPDDDGAVYRGTPTTYTRWGRITPLQGKELYESQRQNYDATHKLVMRPVAGVDNSTETTVTWPSVGGDDYEVVSVLENDAIDERMTMLIKRRVS